MQSKFPPESILALGILTIAIGQLLFASIRMGNDEMVVVTVAIGAVTYLWFTIARDFGKPKHFLTMTCGIFVFSIAATFYFFTEDVIFGLAAEVLATLGVCIFLLAALDMRFPDSVQNFIGRLLRR